MTGLTPIVQKPSSRKGALRQLAAPKDSSSANDPILAVRYGDCRRSLLSARGIYLPQLPKSCHGAPEYLRLSLLALR